MLSDLPADFFIRPINDTPKIHHISIPYAGQHFDRAPCSRAAVAVDQDGHILVRQLFERAAGDFIHRK